MFQKGQIARSQDLMARRQEALNDPERAKIDAERQLIIAEGRAHRAEMEREAQAQLIARRLAASRERLATYATGDDPFFAIRTALTDLAAENARLRDRISALESTDPAFLGNRADGAKGGKIK